MRVEESIEIVRPRDVVWGVIADPANDPRWCDKVKSVEAVSATRWRVMHKPVPLRPPVELVLEQIEVEPPTRLRLRQEDEASVFEVQYVLEPTTAGTRFTQISEFEWKRLPRILHGTFARGVRNDVRRQLRDLKTLVESGPSGA